MTGPCLSRKNEIEDQLDELYPGSSALLLVRLGSPKASHSPQGNGSDHSTCDQPGKRPVEAAWNENALARMRAGIRRTEHLSMISQHLQDGGNIGWVLPPGVIALDADTTASVALLASVLSDSPCQETCKGAHFILRIPLELKLAARVGIELDTGIPVDLRVGAKSQIVCEPSIHASGTPYCWKSPLLKMTKTS